MINTFVKVTTKALLLCAYFIHALSNAQEVDKFSLTPGLWEGISEEDAQYVLLDINENQQHRIFLVYLSSKLGMKKLDFDDSDIHCTQVSCQISLLKTNLEKQLIHLTPKYENGPLLVTDAALDKQGNPILARSYELKRNSNPKSTIRTFLDAFRKPINALKPVQDEQEWFGLWVGTIRTDAGTNIAVLEVKPDGASRFITYILGIGITNDTSFLYKDVVKTPEHYEVETTHATFANQLIFHRKIKNQLEGYFYSYHKGYPLQTGTFSLSRLDADKND